MVGEREAAGICIPAIFAGGGAGTGLGSVAAIRLPDIFSGICGVDVWAFAATGFAAGAACVPTGFLPATLFRANLRLECFLVAPFFPALRFPVCEGGFLIPGIFAMSC